MQIRSLEVRNFRGIRELHWSLPAEAKFVCLIGPGDSGKSSLLEAIYLVLGDRWNPSMVDTDFFEADTSEPLLIRAVLTDLPVTLMKESALGLWLSGVKPDGTMSQDPEDGYAPCVIVQMTVDSTLEPKWTVERLDGSDSTMLTSSQRREFATFKVDDRVDVHLRWTRSSPLGRLSAQDDGAKNAMALAARAAREAIATLDDQELNELTGKVQAKANEVGGGTFRSIRPGLDTSLSSAGGNLALYEANVPLTNFGLGSKRLAGLAVQQLAASNRSLLVVDEIEHGLEPHRLVRLLNYLRTDSSYSQVFITTHSPVVVEQSLTESLAIVRNHDGYVQVSGLPSTGGTALRLRRSRPSSFLARQVLIVEGKTEEGMLLSLIDRWDQEQLVDGLPIAAGEGTVIQDGQGGSEAPGRAEAMQKLGFVVGLLLDNDDRSIDAKVTRVASTGVLVERWEIGKCTESQIIDSLNSDGLSDLLRLGVHLRGSERNVVLDLQAAGLPEDILSLSVGDWLEDGSINLEGAQEIVRDAVLDGAWFKSVDAGRLLGTWIYDNAAFFTTDRMASVLDRLRQFIYPSGLSGTAVA